MSKDGILDWKQAIQDAAHYIRFLENLEASLAEAGDALYLRAGMPTMGRGSCPRMTRNTRTGST